jgi:malonyl CoA-acyl carrier protein transacylase
MTHELAVASGEREEANQAENKTKKLKREESLKEPYHGVDIFTKQLEYMNKVVHINDPMHEIANTVKDILNLLMN